jgi:hypothetical protein
MASFDKTEGRAFLLNRVSTNVKNKGKIIFSGLLKDVGNKVLIEMYHR